MAKFLPYLWSILGIVAVLGVATLLCWVWEQRQLKKHMAKAFAGRPSLEPHDFYEKYFRETGVPLDVVVRIRAILESELGVDLSRLAASDDFSKNLSFFWD